MLTLPVCHTAYNQSTLENIPFALEKNVCYWLESISTCLLDPVGLLCDSPHYLLFVLSFTESLVLKSPNILLQVWKSHSPLLSDQWIKYITKVLWGTWREKLMRGLNEFKKVLTTGKTFPNKLQDAALTSSWFKFWRAKMQLWHIQTGSSGSLQQASVVYWSRESAVNLWLRVTTHWNLGLVPRPVLPKIVLAHKVVLGILLWDGVTIVQWPTGNQGYLETI